MKGNKDMTLQIICKIHKCMTDAIFIQVIFSCLRKFSYNFENKEKYNMNLRFIDV